MSRNSVRGACLEWRSIGRVARAATLIIFGMYAQACGSDIRDEGTDAGTQCACTVGQLCVEGECVPVVGCVDNDQDGFGANCAAGDDCDDNNARVFPGAPERCDDEDNDCDFFIDEDDVCLGPEECVPDCVQGEASCAGEQVLVCNLDNPECGQWERVACPADQYCRFGECVSSCEDRDQDGSPVRCEGVRDDCDDESSDRFPGNVEVCDGIDNNCDTRIDENFVCDDGCEANCTVAGTFCAPSGAGFTTCRDVGDGCLRNSGFTPCGEGQTCIDEACTARPVECIDLDGDGAGPGCGSDDCRPFDPGVASGAVEVCDGVDNDCDGAVDEGGVCGNCTASTQANPRQLRDDGSWYGVACGATEFVSVPGLEGAAVVIAVGGGEGLRRMELVAGAGAPAATSSTLGAFSALRFDLGAGARQAVLKLTTTVGQPVFVGARAVSSGNACVDEFEPNFSEVVATPADRGPFVGAAGLCDADFDYYSIYARTGEIVTATTVSSTDNAQPLVAIVQSGGIVGVSALSNLDAAPALFGRHAHFRAPTNGTFVVQVNRLNPADATERPYALALDTLPAAACTDDALESGAGGLENDTLAGARTLSAGTHRGRLCPGDYDIYSLGVSTGGAVQGTFTTNLENVNVQILEGGWGSIRSFPLDATTRGRPLYIAVYSTDHRVTGDYTLRLDN